MQVAMIEAGLLPPVVKGMLRIFVDNGAVGNLQTMRDMTDIRDSATTIVQLAEIGKSGEAYNIASGM